MIMALNQILLLTYLLKYPMPACQGLTDHFYFLTFGHSGAQSSSQVKSSLFNNLAAPECHKAKNKIKMVS